MSEIKQPVPKAPTKMQLLEQANAALLARVAEHEAALRDRDTQIMALRAQVDARIPKANLSPEALALSDCIRAIEEMRSPNGRTNASSLLGYTPLPGSRPIPTPAGETREGRILLYLAAKYDVPLIDVTILLKAPEPEQP